MKKRNEASKTDFTADKLPSTRFEVFTDCLKIKKSVMVKLGLRILLFCLPLLISYLLMDISASTLYEEYLEGNVELTAVYSTINSFNLINVLLWGLLGVGVAGAFKVVRGIIWQEPVFLNNDFLEGIKLNWKPFFAIFICIGFMIFASSAVYTSGEVSVTIRYLSVFTSVIFLIPVLVITMGLYNVYNVTLREAIFNAFTIYVKKLFSNLLMTLIILVPFALIIAVSGGVKYLFTIVFALIIAPILLIGLHLYLCYLFDIYINRKSYPDYVDKGIHRRK